MFSLIIKKEIQQGIRALLIAILILSLFSQTVGFGAASSALAPQSPFGAEAEEEGMPDFSAPIIFKKESGRWFAEPGKEKYYEIYYQGEKRGWIWYELVDGQLQVRVMSIPTSGSDRDEIYKEVLVKIHSLALEQGINEVVFSGVSNEIYLKYMRMFFVPVTVSYENRYGVGGDGRSYQRPYRKISGLPTCFDWLKIGDKITFTVIRYVDAERGLDAGRCRPVKPFSSGSDFSVRVNAQGELEIDPLILRKLSYEYRVFYDSEEGRFKLLREDGREGMVGVDFQIGNGYLGSDYTFSCQLKREETNPVVGSLLPEEEQILCLEEEEIRDAMIEVLHGGDDAEIVQEKVAELLRLLEGAPYRKVMWHNTRVSSFGLIREKNLKRRFDDKLFWQFYNFTDSGSHLAVLTELARAILAGEDTYGAVDVETHGAVVVPLEKTDFILADSIRHYEMTRDHPDLDVSAYRYINLGVNRQRIKDALEKYYQKHSGVRKGNWLFEQAFSILYLKMIWLDKIHKYFSDLLEVESRQESAVLRSV